MNSKTPESAFFAQSCTAFMGMHSVASGPLVEVALAVKALEKPSATDPIFVFDDSNGEVVELDLRGSTAEIVARLTERARRPSTGAGGMRKPLPSPAQQGPGRPRLGVVAREVTLLPRHWDWLASQPGGASAALRRLVEQARLADNGKTARRQGKEAAYRFLSAMAGNLAGFEEATRALFADDWKEFLRRTAKWPEGVRVYAERLANCASWIDEEVR